MEAGQMMLASGAVQQRAMEVQEGGEVEGEAVGGARACGNGEQYSGQATSVVEMDVADTGSNALRMIQLLILVRIPTNIEKRGCR